MHLFEFDDHKSQDNRKKHGIDFLDAQELRKDIYLLEIQAKSDGEPRSVNRNIVNTIHKVELIQTDKVLDTLLGHGFDGFVRESSELVSSEQTIAFDSSSDSMGDRKNPLLYKR